MPETALERDARLNERRFGDRYSRPATWRDYPPMQNPEHAVMSRPYRVYAGPRIRRLTDSAVNTWNHTVGKQVLQLVSRRENADVEVGFEDTKKYARRPAAGLYINAEAHPGFFRKAVRDRIVIAPYMEKSPAATRALIHELGHLLRLPDRYFEGQSNLGVMGTQSVPWPSIPERQWVGYPGPVPPRQAQQIAKTQQDPWRFERLVPQRDLLGNKLPPFLRLSWHIASNLRAQERELSSRVPEGRRYGSTLAKDRGLRIVGQQLGIALGDFFWRNPKQGYDPAAYGYSFRDYMADLRAASALYFRGLRRKGPGPERWKNERRFVVAQEAARTVARRRVSETRQTVRRVKTSAAAVRERPGTPRYTPRQGPPSRSAPRRPAPKKPPKRGPALRVR
jgi:hypothetical protein